MAPAQRADPKTKLGAKDSARAVAHPRATSSQHQPPLAEGWSAPTEYSSIPTLAPGEIDPFTTCINLGFQPKLTIGTPDDPHEREADAVADRVIRMTEPVSGTPMPIGTGRSYSPRQAQQSNQLQAKSDNPAQTNYTLPPGLTLPAAGHGGTSLSPEVRAYFEPRFGYDFGGVRVHTDGAAQRAAGTLSARAYTHGGDIVFGAGEYAPSTTEGKRLLAHELTHVVQQASGLARGRTQAKPDDKKQDASIKVFSFRVNIDHAMNADEFLHEFVKQYYSFTTETQIQARLSTWTNNTQRVPTPTEVKQGFAIIKVGTTGLTDFEALDPDEKKKINAETDKRFWESTGYKPGQKLGNSAKDREMARVWKGVRTEVLTEDKQRKDIDALPPDIKDVLFAGSVNASTVSPEDYDQVLRIAHKLASLSPEARKDYLNRVNASTTSFNALEQSIDNYIQFQAQREKQAKEKDAAAKPLLGAEDVYTLYKNYKRLQSNLAFAKSFKDVGKDPGQARDSIDYLEAKVQETETALLEALKKSGFDSITAFEAAMESYRVAFRTQAVNLALDVLARYEHMLFEERKKLQTPGYGGTVASGIAATQASQHYKEANSKEWSAVFTEATIDPKDTANTPRERREVTRLRSEASTARKTAESEVIAGSGNDPLVKARGTNLEKLAGLDAAGTQDYLSKTLDKRAEEARIARQELIDDPDRVFKLPDLIAASLEIQHIGADTIYGRIINDYIDDEKFRHILSQLAIGIIAIALAFLIPVGGWVAAAALVTNAGISVYQAYTAYKEYEEQERDYNLHFLSDEPSLFWVGLAIAGAALDLGVATSVVVKESSAALKTLKGPMLEFSKDSDLAKLVSKIEAADGLKAQVKAALAREAEASLAADAALKEFSGKLFAFSPHAPPDPGMAKQAFRALYYTVKKGVNTIEAMRADAKFVAAIGDITRITATERAELETAFDEVKELVKLGQAKSMDENSLLGYIDRWAINRENATFRPKLLEDMNAWKPLTAEQTKALEAVAEQKGVVTDLYKEEQSLLAEREELAAKQRDPATRTEENREQLQSINERLGELDPKYKRQTYKQRVTTTNAQGEVAEHYVDVPIKHPPGEIAQAETHLSAVEKAAADSQLSLYDRLRAAAPSAAARERTLKGVSVDQVGPLKTTATPLEAEHIVSVREIADMDGFADLPWKDQKEIADMRINLVAMDGSANGSKGSRTWRSWNQASAYYDQSTIDAMIAREANARAAIKAEISARLHPLPKH